MRLNYNNRQRRIMSETSIPFGLFNKFHDNAVLPNFREELMAAM